MGSIASISPYRSKNSDTNSLGRWGLVTHGCIRMYPEDIAQFFDIIRIGVPGEFVYQPVKIGVLYGKVYVEVHEDIYKLVPDLWAEAQKVVRESGYEEMVDSVLLTKALMQKNGLPTDITRGSQSWKALNGEVADLDTEEPIMELNFIPIKNTKCSILPPRLRSGEIRKRG
jgi:hypothetical protein